MLRLNAMTHCLLGSCLLAAGCAVPAVAPLDPSDNSSIQSYREAALPVSDRGYALAELQRGDLFLGLGNYRHADRRFANALDVMQRVGDGGSEGVAVALNESARTFRGEPYERAAANFYRSVCNYQMGEFERALAAARAALSCDQETVTDDDSKRGDFSAAELMAALAFSRLGEHDNARRALARASAAAREPLDPAVIDDNLVILLPLGIGPQLRQGMFWTKSYFAPPTPVTRIELIVDGASRGEAACVMDMVVQADSQQSGAPTAAAVGRGVLKIFINAVLGTNLQELRDVRCWRTLPSRYYVASAQVPPGAHTVVVKCFDAKGEELIEHRQTWHDIPVDADPRLLVMRLLPGVQNVHGLELQPLTPATHSETELDS